MEEILLEYMPLDGIRNAMQYDRSKGEQNPSILWKSDQWRCAKDWEGSESYKTHVRS